MVFLSPYRKIPLYEFKIGHDQFPPHLYKYFLQLIISWWDKLVAQNNRYISKQSTQWRVTSIHTVLEVLTKRQKNAWYRGRKLNPVLPEYEEGVVRLFMSRHPSIHPVILLLSSSQFYAGRWTHGLQSPLPSHNVSFHIYRQFFHVSLTPSSIWPNHLVLDHSTGFFLLSFNSKNPSVYPCSTYSFYTAESLYSFTFSVQA